MTKNKLFRTAFVVISAIGLLTACTPPMPPEFKAEIAEKYVTCVDGGLTVSAPAEFSDVAQSWIDGLAESCSGFTGSVVDSVTPADVVISSAGAKPSCSVAASSPVGLDSVAISVSVDGLDGVVFSPALLYKAFSGQMTSWADPELQDLNPDLELADTPVILRSAVRTTDLSALNDWMSRLDPAGWPGTPSGLIPNDELDPELVTTEIEAPGTLAVLPASFALGASAQTVGILIDETQDAVGVNSESIYSAGTQFVPAVSGSVVIANLDSSIEPTPVPGSDVVALPWQALNQFNMYVCSGANEMVGRAFARFALRLDSQGSLPVAGFYEIPETVRIAAVDAVSIGLPEPSIPPTDAPAEVVPTDMPTDDPTDMPTEEPAVDVTDAATPEPTS